MAVFYTIMTLFQSIGCVTVSSRHKIKKIKKSPSGPRHDDKMSGRTPLEEILTKI